MKVSACNLALTELLDTTSGLFLVLEWWVAGQMGGGSPRL